MLYYERRLKSQGVDIIIGVDEAGRGPLAGPVVAAAVYLKKNNFKQRIDDSKKLTPLQRQKAYQEIFSNSLFGIGIVNEKIIDKLGISLATSKAMKEAIEKVIDKLKLKNKKRIHIIVDGFVDLKVKYPFTNIIKGDSQSLTIACASILAKVTRDRIMCMYDKVFPQYNFSQHKGYPTTSHIKAIKKFGPSPIQRLTFSYA
ncbi:MAG: ribonuclease HII [Candidatus Omnitrophica bacterium]|nr:ribonuclease HII [Candidatus Omnitrophota bacterium]MCM8770522.1 ribonuclease HII [Candidatus Omnitrophota bacterium]